MLKKVLIDSFLISVGVTIISALIYPLMNLELNPLRFFVMSFILWIAVRYFIEKRALNKN